MTKEPSGAHHEDMLIPGNRGRREHVDTEVWWSCRLPVVPGDTGHFSANECGCPGALVHL